ncbi:MAG: sensor histidine kinase [Bullifex sp.]
MKKYSDLKIQHKISIVMGLILMVLCLLLCLITLTIFTEYYKEESRDIATQWARVSARNIDQHLNEIYDRILKTTVNRDFVSAITDPDVSLLRKRVDLQTDLSQIKNSSAMISSVFFITDREEMIASFDDIPIPGNDDFSYDSLSGIRGVSILSERQSPFMNGVSVIPYVIPYRLISGSSYLGITNDEAPNLILVVLLSADRVRYELEESTSRAINLVPQLYFQGERIFPERSAGNDAYVTRVSCSMGGLVLEVSIDLSSLSTMQNKVFLLSITGAVLLAVLGVCIINVTARHLMLPFGRITAMMNRMKANTYDFDVTPRYRDESGELIRGLNDMYSQLLDNMERIKREEEEKFTYLSQMLTEQINPHFTYNTLEMINMEILSGNLDTASDMVSAFSLFLRYSLNHGQYLIPVSNELSQVENYMKIMNYRLNGVIDFIISCPDEIKGHSIPKSILQPLAENSIRHGFDSLRGEGFINPTIEISLVTEGDRVKLTVADNGSGIDINKAERAMMEDDSEGHVGLSNIRRRLALFDPDSSIRFSAIPYYRNEVILEFSLFTESNGKSSYLTPSCTPEG